MTDVTHDTGCKTNMGLLPGVRGSALLTGVNGEHRLQLGRDWGDEGAPFALWVGMNPSGADASHDDLTVRKEQVWTQTVLGLSSYVKMNFGTYRATQPSALSAPGVTVCLSVNPRLIAVTAGRASKVVLTCGKPPAVLEPFVREAFALLGEVELLCLGTTKEGWPKHSSRLGYATPFTQFRQMPDPVPARRRRTAASTPALRAPG